MQDSYEQEDKYGNSDVHTINTVNLGEIGYGQRRSEGQLT
jgi:hypothetical protein